MLIEIERVLVRALHDERPVERLRELVAAAGEFLDDGERARLLAIEPDGFRMASLVVRRLRIDRVLGGDAEVRAWSEADPAAFAETYRRYVAAVPPTTEFPEVEARAFRAFRDGA